MQKIYKSKKEFFETNETKDINFRIMALKKLKINIQKLYDKELIALKKDLNKSEFESYLSEIGPVISEINYHMKNLKKWSKVKKVKTPFTLMPSKSYIYSEPLGVVLIIAPWNYPLHLSLIPLIGAISAGNTVVIKPSELAKESSSIIKEIIDMTFDKKYVEVVEGGIDETTKLLEQKFDMVFFTGSTKVGKIINQKVAPNLSKVVLELGGKSPCIIDENVNLNLVAKRILFGKLMNSGQTCIAPDYILIKENLKEQFIDEIKKNLSKFKANNLTDMVRIISERHYNRLIGLLENESILIEGKKDLENLKLGLNVVDSGKVEYYINNERVESKLMQEEIFGTILPIITYKKLDETIKYVKLKEKPLALYLFSNDKKNINRVLNEISFGGGCINDTLIHLANHNMPFGGVGNSGLLSYHGKNSFEVFSHKKSIMKSSNLIDISLRYMPYTKNKLNILKKLFK